MRVIYILCYVISSQFVFILGIQAHSSHHPCPYCTAARYNKKGKKSVKGDWGDGAVRTPDSIRQDNMFWLRKGRRATKKREAIRGGGGVKKKLAQFNSCQARNTEEQVQLVEPDYFNKKTENMNKLLPDVRQQASEETEAGDAVPVNMDIDPQVAPGQEVGEATITSALTRKTKAELIKVTNFNKLCIS